MQGPRPLSKALHDLARWRKFEIGLFWGIGPNLGKSLDSVFV